MTKKVKRGNVKKVQEMKPVLTPDTEKEPVLNQDEYVELSLQNMMIPIALSLAGVMIALGLFLGLRGQNSSEENDVLGKSDTTNETQMTDSLKTTGTLSTFTKYEGEICKENGKPVVYLFSTTSCPHCQWIKSTFDDWAKKQTDVVVYHWELNTGDNTLTSEAETSATQTALDVYNKFNPSGTVPTFVFGCQYSRVGNGFESSNDLQKEVDEYNKVVKELLK